MLTCYDATFARLLDGAGVDVLLIGDSLGMVIQGHETTLPVTLEEVLYHARAVARGTTYAHLVADLPFMSYQVGTEQALASAGRMMKEGGVAAVKLEGGARIADSVYACTQAGIPVMGHLGLTPQSIHQLGGYKIQGKKPSEADALLDDALALQEAGAYSVVLEGIPELLGHKISAALTIPTIGIGAGRYTDGQVLVIYDLLGLDPSFNPTFVRQYADMATITTDAVRQFCADVQSGAFPSVEEVFMAAEA
jgi:3-methyl-2-oxobutanoate hydroxymethyltransferase